MIPSQTVENLQQALKLALSMTLLYWLALSLDWDLPQYGALAVALISLDTTGASLAKGIMRIVGTTIGLAVGLVGLALLAQNPALTLLYHSTFLVIVGYFMQSSRYPYAWFVAGFLPSLVWATTYGKIDNAFSYATFRYLETTAGIVIYTVVSTVLWPRNAGDKLNQQGRDFWQQLHGLLGLYRRQLDDGQLPEDAPTRRAAFDGTASQLIATLKAAYADTPSVATQRSTWECFSVDARALCDSLELWRQSIDDCRHLDMDRVLPEVRGALENLDERIARIGRLWQTRSAGKQDSDTIDGNESLLHWQKLNVHHNSLSELSHLDRAALLSFVQHLNLLLRITGKLLQTMRVLSGFGSAKDLDTQSLPKNLYRPARWDLARLVSGLLPAVSFIVAYFFWIHFDPPAGPSVPSMAATFGLLAVMTPINVLVLIPLALIVIGGFIAPMYFLVMPRLSTGPELLTFIFVFAFSVSALFVGRLSVLKTLILSLFVSMTGISNDQNYSFTGLVDGALMILLAIGIIAIVQTFVSPLKPEQVLLKNVRRFFRGCAQVTHGYAAVGPACRAKGRRIRKQYFESMVLPAPVKIQTAMKHLDYKMFPDNPPEIVQRLIDAMQSIGNRLQALEIAQQRIAAHAVDLPESFTLVSTGLRDYLQSVLERCGRLEPGEAPKQQRAELRRLTRDLQECFDQLEESRGQDDSDDQLLADLYAAMGSVRGLIDAMDNGQVVISQINWHQWATPRF